MIRRVEISGVHAMVTKDLQKYILKKLNHLERYVPRAARKSTHATVLLKEAKTKNKKSCTAEIVLHLPGENLTATESTINMYAAVDIVQAKLKSQLQKYKVKHEAGGDRSRRRLRNYLAKIYSR